MKFENDYFKIEITKKKLTKEQKQEKRKKLKRKIPVLISVFVLVIGVFISAKILKKNNKVSKDNSLDASQTDAQVASVDNKTSENQSSSTEELYYDQDAKYVTPVTLVASTKSKYGESQYGYTYGEPISGVKRTDKIELQLGYNMDALVEKEGLDNWGELYGLYTDAELTKSRIADYKFDSDSGIVTISPYGDGLNRISTNDVDTDIVSEYPHSAEAFFDSGANTEWGNCKIMYLANYYDEETGEKLEKPQVRIISMVGELSTEPIVNYSIADNGRLHLKWTGVEGASIYMICEVSVMERMDKIMKPIGYTSELEWLTESPNLGDTYMNGAMQYFDIGEDDWYSGWISDERLEKYKEQFPEAVESKGVIKNKFGFVEDKYLCVIAMSKEGTSMPSNMIDYSMLASNLPFQIARNIRDEKGFKETVSSINDIPVYDYIEMCDGRAYSKLIDYKTEEASIVAKHYVDTDDNGDFIGTTDVQCLNIPYVVEGTSFVGTIVVQGYDESNLEKDVKDIEDRETQIRMKGGSVSPNANTELEVLVEDASKEVAINEDNHIYANSALVEYLTLSMLSGKRNIDLMDFPEAKDIKQLQDALFEAYYQNPLILGIKGYNTFSNNDYIAISYDYTAQEQGEMQKQVRAKVAEITAAIIKDGMTDEEKEMAINEYLCSSIEYDFDAVEDASKNNYREVSDQYRNSFNAYGALVDGKCVCQGYASAFKLLADAAGLEAIMVTGMLDGEVPHAWNKVKIEDAWCVIDTTNNDNEFVVNALFNVPETVSSKVLVENDKYMLDSYMSNYVNNTADYEYYHLTNNYYDIASVAEEIADNLKDNEGAKIIIRTDYDMTDDDFSLVCSQIYDRLGTDRELHGCHWLGVICVY